MKLDPKTLKPVEWAVIGAGALSFIALFLPWFGASFGPYSATVSGFGTSYGWLGGLLVVAAAVWFTLGKAGAALPELPVSHAVVALGAAGLGLFIVAIRWLTLPRYSGLGHTVSYGGRIGIWIALLAALVEVGALAAMFAKSGESLPWQKEASKS